MWTRGGNGLWPYDRGRSHYLSRKHSLSGSLPAPDNKLTYPGYLGSGVEASSNVLEGPIANLSLLMRCNVQEFCGKGLDNLHRSLHLALHCCIASACLQTRDSLDQQRTSCPHRTQVQCCGGAVRLRVSARGPPRVETRGCCSAARLTALHALGTSP
jgi:hypothetical protein